jgi:hypothetical protein
MPFPDTVSPTSKVSESGYYGPFFHGNALYVVNTVSTEEEGTFLSVYRSLDGIVFDQMDQGNAPSLEFSSPFTYAVCQNASQIYCLYIDPDTAETSIRVFDAATNEWGAVLGSVANGAGLSIAAYRPASDDIVIIGGDSVETFFLNHGIPAFFVFDIDSATFSAVTPMDYEDYEDATLWSLTPVGIAVDSDGRTHVFSQQIPARSSSETQSVQFTEDGDFDVPGDCLELLSIRVFGAGGGGGGGTLDGHGGGGGGGFSGLASLAVTPGDTLPVVVGAGGTQGVAGGASSFEGVIAGGGSAGSDPTGGGGGAGDFAGGSGGDGTGALTGGGGGGSAGTESAGQNGGDGGANEGGLGGAPGTGGDRGAGGGGGTINGAFGIPDGTAGSNGGGGGGGVNNGTGGTGGDGLVTFEYLPFTNEHPGRMYHQAILANGTLGALQEITQGTFPFGNGPVAFDVKPGNGFVVVAFSGVTETLNGSISVGRASNADSLTLSFQSVDVENGGSGIDPSPALAINGSSTYLIYMRATSLLDVEWFYRLSTSGGAFGGPVSIGEFVNPGCRIQSGFGLSKLCLTFWIPTNATLDFVQPEEASLFLTSLIPGLGGNLIRVILTPTGPLSVTVTPSDVSQYLIEVNYDPGGDAMADVAAFINASGAGAIVNAQGEGTGTLQGDSNMGGGTSGQGDLP